MDNQLLFTIIFVLAGISVIQYYRGRKMNLILMEHYIRMIKDVVKPEDENYTWLGGYIGFRAEYKVNRDNIREFEYTLHSFQGTASFTSRFRWSRADTTSSS